MPALIGAIAGILSIVGVYNYVPLAWFEFGTEPQLGATITTILGTDTLSSSRTVINNNFANLNSDKFETTGTTLANLTSAASLATVGTITSGTWNATKITVPYGGTGSTTLSQYQVLLGNGTGNVTVPVGWGSSGQFLTSNGSGVIPSWQSATVNQTDNYTWFGTHLFNATTSIAASSTVGNPLKLNTVAYRFPNIQAAASSSVLMNDANGNLAWGTGLPRYTYIRTTDISVSGAAPQFSTTTLFALPASFMTASSSIVMDLSVSCTSNNVTSCYIYLRDATGANLANCIITTTANDTYFGNLRISVFPNNSNTSQVGICSGKLNSTDLTEAHVQIDAEQTSSINFNSAVTLSLVGAQNDNNATLTIKNVTIQANP